jgi:hypothetical protein
VLRGLGALPTVRLPAALGWPDLAKSEGVVGVRELPQGRYAALLPGAQVTLALTPAPPAGPYLLASNAAVVSFRREGQGVRLRLRGHVPVDAEIGGCPGPLSVHRPSPAEVSHGNAIKTRSTGNITVKAHNLRFPEPDTGEIDVICH